MIAPATIIKLPIGGNPGMIGVGFISRIFGFLLVWTGSIIRDAMAGAGE